MLSGKMVGERGRFCLKQHHVEKRWSGNVKIENEKYPMENGDKKRAFEAHPSYLEVLKMLKY